MVSSSLFMKDESGKKCPHTALFSLLEGSFPRNHGCFSTGRNVGVLIEVGDLNMMD